MKVQEFFRQADESRFQTNRRFAFKGAWLEIGGKRNFYKSAWERNYARFLEREKLAGRIVEWHYEPQTFWFEKIMRGTRTYKPDFRVKQKDEKIVFCEVKGWLTPKSRVQLKRMKKYHPTVTIFLVRADWFKARKHFEHVIEGWEK